MKKLFAKALLVVALIVAAAMPTTAQESFAYQAVVRNAEGELVTNQDVTLKFSLLNGGETEYAETQKTKANQYGNISVMIGAGEKTKGDFAKVSWNTLDITLKVEVKLAGSDKFIELGQTKINPVPYAMYAAKAGGAATVNGAPKGTETLFEVNDREGRPVFAVTDNGIVVYVDDTETSDKVRRSGFLIVGRDATKGGSGKEYFSVTADGTQINVDDENSDKLRRSGFLITGRDATKEGSADYLSVDGNGTTVYVDVNSDDKIRRSGFMITGRDATKDGEQEMFSIDGGQTTVYVDDLGDGKVRRSGFLIVGRDATKGDKGIVDINGSRTNLTTATLSIASANANDADAPVSALHITEETVTMNSGMAMEGGVRPALDDEKIEEMEEYKVWLSDSRTDDEPDGYDFTNSWGDFYFYNQSYYSWLGAFHDDLVVPLSSEYSMLMFNRDGEETAIAEDAVVVVFYEYGDINVWPLAALNDFTVSFAMTNYYPTSAFSGNADEYARYNVTLNSTKPYAGCNVYLDGEIPYTAKITTSERSFEQDVIKNENGSSNAGFDAVFGQKVTMEAANIPADKLFNYWLVNGRRYYDNPVTLPVMSSYTRTVAVFKDESEKLWVDGSFKPESDDVQLDGSEDLPYNSIAYVLDSVIAKNNDPRVGFRIIVQSIYDSIIIKTNCDGDAKYISMDIDDSHIYQIKDSTTVPVYVRNMSLQPENSNIGEAILVTNGANLTLEGCAISGNDNISDKMHGAYVNSGNLTLINTAVSNFTAEQGGGVYVASGATLTVKGNTSQMEISGNTAEQGGGIYVADGATLNVSGGQISGNNFADGAANPAGADIYLAGDKAVFNLNPNGYGSEIGKIGLASGAMITAVGNYPIYERYHDEPEETPCVASFDYIENTKDALVKLGQNVQPNNLPKISQCFRVVARNLLADGYSSTLNSEAKLFKFNRVYATGKIGLGWENNIYTNVDYTYYRNEKNNEYLYLKYSWDYYNEYRNYWIVDGKIYGDTIYVKTNSLPAQPIQNFAGENFSRIFSDYTWPNDDKWTNVYIDNTHANTDINLLGSQQIGSEYEVYTEDGWTMFRNNDDDGEAYIENNVVVGCDVNFFKKAGNLAIFKSLIEPSVSIAGREVGFNDIDKISECQWYSDYYNYTLVNDEATSEGIVEIENEKHKYELEDEDVFKTEKDVFEYRDEPRKQTLDEVETMFYDLKNGFTVTLAASLGGKIINNNNEYTGDNNTFTINNYGYTIILLARPDEGFVFSGWSDGVINPERTVGIGGHQNLTAKFSKEFYVSSDGSDETGNGLHDTPYKSFSKAVETISGIGTKYNYVINVLSPLNEAQTIEGDFTANEITINGNNATLDGTNISEKATALTISTTVPVIIRNLTIQKWKVARGGGIYNNGGTLTLESGTKITDNTSEGTESYQGGAAIFSNGGTVTINSGVEISNNTATARGGAIALMNGAHVTLNGGNIVQNNAGSYGGAVIFCHEGNVDNNYNDAPKSYFTMESGVISDNYTIKDYSFGGCAYIVNGEFVLNGGEIINNQAVNGGGAIFNDDTFIMTGGTIEGNSATNSGGEGGAIDNYGTVKISGGTISENSASIGGAIYNKVDANTTSKLEISGSAYIPEGVTEEGNLVTGPGKNDVYLMNGSTITVTGSLTHEAPVATITLASYSETVQVLDGDFADLECGKFNVTDEETGDGPKQWLIHPNGHLADPSKISLNPTNNDEAYTINDPSKPCIFYGSKGSYYGEIDIVFENDETLEPPYNYDITLYNVNRVEIPHKSALQLKNQTNGKKVNFKITLEGKNILYGYNHSGVKVLGDDNGAISNVIFNTNQEATLEFKSQDQDYRDIPCLQVDGVTANFILADGCSFVSGRISKKIFVDDPDNIDRENDELFNIYDSFDAFINAARNTRGRQLCILKIKRD